MSKAKTLIDICDGYESDRNAGDTSKSHRGSVQGKGKLGGDKSGHPNVTTPGAIAVQDHGWEEYWAANGMCPPGYSRVGDTCVRDREDEE